MLWCFVAGEWERVGWNGRDDRDGREKVCVTSIRTCTVSTTKYCMHKSALVDQRKSQILKALHEICRLILLHCARARLPSHNTYLRFLARKTPTQKNMMRAQNLDHQGVLML